MRRVLATCVHWLSITHKSMYPALGFAGTFMSQGLFVHRQLLLSGARYWRYGWSGNGTAVPAPTSGSKHGWENYSAIWDSASATPFRRRARIGPRPRPPTDFSTTRGSTRA